MSAEDQIRQFAERIVRLEEERKALAADIKDVKAEAKAAGFSPKLIATCVRIMLLEAEKRAEALAGHEELDLYLSAVGLVAGRPDHETRRDAGGRGGCGQDGRPSTLAQAEATKVVDRAAQCASATDDVIRSYVTGSDVGGLCLASSDARRAKSEADAVGETCASVSATNSPVWHGAAEGAPRPGGECGSIPRRAPDHSHRGAA